MPAQITLVAIISVSLSCSEISRLVALLPSMPGCVQGQIRCCTCVYDCSIQFAVLQYCKHSQLYCSHVLYVHHGLVVVVSRAYQACYHSTLLLAPYTLLLVLHTLCYWYLILSVIGSSNSVNGTSYSVFLLSYTLCSCYFELCVLAQDSNAQMCRQCVPSCSRNAVM